MPAIRSSKSEEWICWWVDELILHVIPERLLQQSYPGSNLLDNKNIEMILKRDAACCVSTPNKYSPTDIIHFPELLNTIFSWIDPSLRSGWQNILHLTVRVLHLHISVIRCLYPQLLIFNLNLGICFLILDSFYLKMYIYSSDSI